MCIGDCKICDKTLYEGEIEIGIAHTDVFYCYNCSHLIQPERLNPEDHIEHMLGMICDSPNTPTKGSESTRNE